MKTISKSVILVFFAVFVFGVSNMFGQEESQKINDLIEKKRTFNKTHKNSLVFKDGSGRNQGGI